ncbi:hypothetical protein BC943DRAFT_172373 [Umbelopsis sp. AD052]|nr:hypothetical protein BC943DRAFT_172373 [Umbelopsis sp. AD052]
MFSYQPRLTPLLAFNFLHTCNSLNYGLPIPFALYIFTWHILIVLCPMFGYNCCLFMQWYVKKIHKCHRKRESGTLWEIVGKCLTTSCQHPSMALSVCNTTFYAEDSVSRINKCKANCKLLGALTDGNMRVIISLLRVRSINWVLVDAFVFHPCIPSKR